MSSTSNIDISERGSSLNIQNHPRTPHIDTVFPILPTFLFSTFPTFSGNKNEDIDDWINQMFL